MGVKIIKVNIEINMNDVEAENNKVSPEPTVKVDYDNRGMNNKQMWYMKYINNNKWIRIEGQGNTVNNCEDIVIRRSPGNKDILNKELTFKDKYWGVGKYKDYPNNLYIQSLKLNQLLNIGYNKGDSNFTELID